MKLPGVTYQAGVQSLGRRDTSAPLKLAQAETQAADAWAQALHSGVESADEILDNIAKDERVKGMNAYNKAMLEWSATQTYHDEKAGTDASQDGDKRFNSAEDAARAAAMEVVKSTRGQRLFNQSADEASVRYGADWLNKVEQWRREEDAANRMEAVDIYTRSGEYDVANQVIEESLEKGVFSAGQAAKARGIVMGTEVVRSHEASIEAAESAETLNAARERIENDTQLSDQARAGLEARLLEHVVNIYTTDMRQVLSAVEEQSDETTAAMYGDSYIHEMAKITDSAIDGLSNEQRRKVLGAIRNVQREWQAKADDASYSAKRDMEMFCLDPRECLATDQRGTQSNKRLEYTHRRMIGGVEMKGGKWEFALSDTEMLSQGGEGEKARLALVEMSVGSNYVSDYLHQLIDKGLTSKNPEYTQTAISMLNGLTTRSPSIINRMQKGIVKDMANIANMFGREKAAELINNRLSTQPNELATYQAQFDKERENINLDKFFETFSEGGFLWFNSTPERRAESERMVMEMTREAMVYSRGDLDGALGVVRAQLENTYGVSNATGKKMFTKHPPERIVPYGERNGGDWIQEQFATDFQERFGTEVPENVHMHLLPGTEKDRPIYYVSYLDPELGMVQGATFEFDYYATPQGVDYLDELSAERDRIDNEANTTRAIETLRADPSKAAPNSVQRDIGKRQLLEGVTEVFAGTVDVAGKAYQQLEAGVAPVTSWVDTLMSIPEQSRQRRKEFIEKQKGARIEAEFREQAEKEKFLEGR